MGACSRDIFFVLERLLADKAYTIDSIGIGRLEDIRPLAKVILPRRR
jgi:hypothetical protein